ncbi:hypothetical protein L1889_17250 [Paenalcaligenes niemegkensis]|nr:hypothetical protein [Paenalcaligenes niemegkensis]MCQ9618203.1 hypothetical protein [Paenalcaligenes niemegkensis]
MKSNEFIGNPKNQTQAVLKPGLHRLNRLQKGIRPAYHAAIAIQA